MATSVTEMIDERMRLATRAREIQETGLAEFRDLDEAELKEFTGCMTQIRELTSAIERRCVTTSR